MSPTTLQSALESLYGLERRKSKLGLDGTRVLLRALGNPETRFRSVHVAGTNGKGSTCALIERALRAAGHRTGLFTSPHLVDFRERIRVNGRWAGEEWLFDALRRIEALGGTKDRTFFEVATALGFGWFAAEHVEWAVVEVGLGGRLDTTNVLDSDVCAITSIGLDHQEILGHTIEAIAREKAGIVKHGVPVVVAPGLDPRARAEIDTIARVRQADVIDAAGFAADPESLVGSGRERGAGPAALSASNVATALAVLATLRSRGVSIPAPAIAEGFRDARWPGRFERAPHAPRLWWDGAHNPDAVDLLIEAWKRADLQAPRAIVLAVSRDKDVATMLEQLARLNPDAVLWATRTRSERALEPESIAAAARARGFAVHTANGVAEACEAALAATGPEGLVLLTGSLFAIGEAMEVFGGAPGEQL